MKLLKYIPKDPIALVKEFQCQSLRHCEEIRWTKMTQDFSAMTRRRSAGILGVFQALTTKSEPKKTSQIVQIIFEQCLKGNQELFFLL